jgi:hypothetical protein
MRKVAQFIFLAVTFLVLAYSIKMVKATQTAPTQEQVALSTASMTIVVGGSIFVGKLYDNDTTKALLSKLPMTLDMRELNGNEKYYCLPERLPNDPQRIPRINLGDIMLYGSDCLVLFYASFSTPYSYTRIGYIEDTSGLVAALGDGNVTVTFYAK